MEQFIFVEIISTIIAITALIISMIQLRMTFRADVVIRVHYYFDCTMLEIVNIGTIGASNIVVEFSENDVTKIAKLVRNPDIKKQVECLSKLKEHKLQLLPQEIKPYVLYLLEDRESFGKAPILLHGVVHYKSFLGIARKKNVIIDVSGTGSAIYEKWPTDKDDAEDTK